MQVCKTTGLSIGNEADVECAIFTDFVTCFRTLLYETPDLGSCVYTFESFMKGNILSIVCISFSKQLLRTGNWNSRILTLTIKKCAALIQPLMSWPISAQQAWVMDP